MKSILNFLWTVVKWIFTTLFAVAKYLYKRNPEVFTIPLVIWLFYQIANYIYSIDPLASRLDTSTFLVPIFAIFALVLFLWIVWVIMGLLFSNARNFLANELKTIFQNLTPWEKVKYSTGIFFGLLYSLVFLCLVIA